MMCAFTFFAKMLSLRSKPLRVYASANVSQDLTQPMPKLCKDCKWFRSDPNYVTFLTGRPTELGYRFGKCTRHGSVDLVSGIITYEYADVARAYTCKGTHFCEVSPLRDD